MSSDRYSNLLLQSFPEKSYQKLLPDLRIHQFALGEILFHPDDEINRVYFPGYGTLASIIAHTEKGDSVEIGIAANDGCAGMGVLLGTNNAVHEVLVQIAGPGVSVGRDLLRQIFLEDSRVRDVFLRYMHSLFTFVSQTALCNRLHSSEERLAHWLLTCEDRVGSDLLTTQEFLARMLGSSRATVNLAAGNLQKNRIIQYNRGKVLITDRIALEAATCECYAIGKKHQFTATISVS